MTSGLQCKALTDLSIGFPQHGERKTLFSENVIWIFPFPFKSIKWNGILYSSCIIINSQEKERGENSIHRS